MFTNTDKRNTEEWKRWLCVGNGVVSLVALCGFHLISIYLSFRGQCSDVGVGGGREPLFPPSLIHEVPGLT